MPTVCELKIEAKRLGLKGYSNLKKAQLQNMVNSATSPGPKKRTAQQQRSKDMSYAARVGKKQSGSFYGTGRNPYD